MGILQFTVEPCELFTQIRHGYFTGNNSNLYDMIDLLSYLSFYTDSWPIQTIYPHIYILNERFKYWRFVQ